MANDKIDGLFTPRVENTTMKNPKNLTVCVDICKHESSNCFREALAAAQKETDSRQWDYYKVYLKHMFGHSDFPVDSILKKLERLRDNVIGKLEVTDYSETMLVRNLLDNNEYISKNTRKPGLTVKLFRSYYREREIIVKTYVYDPYCPSLQQSVESNFENEVLFQLYANNLRVDFISPELYSWGHIRRHKFERDGYEYKCLYLMMEYIPHLTLRESTYTAENMRVMYDKVAQINRRMIGQLLHHNDLHNGNIMVDTRSPLPEIIILDFGEASLGPKKPLFLI